MFDTILATSPVGFSGKAGFPGVSLLGPTSRGRICSDIIRRPMPAFPIANALSSRDTYGMYIRTVKVPEHPLELGC